MEISQLETLNFFHARGDELFYPLLKDTRYPWELLSRIGTFVRDLGPQLPLDRFEHRGDDVWIARSASIAEFTTIQGPAIIGEAVQLRPGAFIRGQVFVGDGSVVGNATELKNVLFFGRTEAPHFNYVGDSVLSYGAHLGAGAITSNLRADRQKIVVRLGCEVIETGLRKFGAMIAEDVEVGCNTVLSPGVFIGQGSVIYPLSLVRQNVPSHCIYKNRGEVADRRPCD